LEPCFQKMDMSSAALANPKPVLQSNDAER
jgi:hypothetical protein